MNLPDPSFSVGIEEEYLLVDRVSRDLVTDMPDKMLEDCSALADGQAVSRELLRSQIEVGTRVCHNQAEARAALLSLRRAVVEVADHHGLAPIAAATHPFAVWQHQKRTERARYAVLAEQMQAAARRLLICGMHVHVGIDDDELRIDLMNQLSYFLPHLLALSCSSPFWEGEDTGLKSYRLTVFDALPRTGIPEQFASYAEFQRHINTLVNAKLIDDGTMIWWDLRPSARYPTLETRVMDVCTSVDDALCLAAFVTCVLRMLYRLRCRNQRWRIYTPTLLRENRWRAMRYGFEAGLLDLAKGEIVPFADLLEELLELVSEDMDALECRAQVEHARIILNRGSSAQQQIAVHAAALANGADPLEAMQAVVDHLIAETAAGLAA